MKRLFLGTLLTFSLFNSNIEASPAAAAKAFGRAAKVALESGVVGLLYFPVKYYYDKDSINEKLEFSEELNIKKLEAIISYSKLSRKEKRKKGKLICRENSLDAWHVEADTDSIRYKIQLVKECKDVLERFGESESEVRIMDGKTRDFAIQHNGKKFVFLSTVKVIINPQRFYGYEFVDLNMENCPSKKARMYVCGHEVAHLSQTSPEYNLGILPVYASGFVKRTISKPSTTTLRFLGRVLYRNPMCFAGFYLILNSIRCYNEWMADVRSAEVLNCADGGQEWIRSFIKDGLEERDMRRDISKKFLEDFPIRYNKGLFNILIDIHGSITAKYPALTTGITKNGNNLMDWSHPPLTWRLKQMQKLAKKQAEEKAKKGQE